MARQILTFFIIFVAISFLMRGCMPSAKLDSEPPIQSIAAPNDGDIVDFPSPRDANVVARFDRNGTLLVLRDGDTTLVRLAPSYSRPFHLLLINEDGKKGGLPRDDWESKVENGALRFSFARDGLEVSKHFAWNDDGKSLRVTVTATGADQVRNIWMTGVCGVPLGDIDALGRAGLVWKLNDGRTTLKSYAGMLELREQERSARLRKIKADADKIPGRLPYAVRRELASGTKVNRFGVTNRAWALTLRPETPVSQLYADVFLARRVGDLSAEAGGSDDGEERTTQGTTPEIETWVDLVVQPDGTYDGTFTFGWEPRAALELPQAARDARTAVLENDHLRVVFTDEGAAIQELWLKQFTERAGEPLTEENWIPVLRNGVRAGERPLTILSDDDRYGIDPARAFWTMTSTASTVTFNLTSPSGWTFEKSISLPEPGRYDLGVDVTLTPPPGSLAKQ
ncbi:MAG: hypothetical protein OER88_05645, partial [Planctomycetota bacterium]|nr:hypothetical protein [Planctomycetota bacterium]